MRVRTVRSCPAHSLVRDAVGTPSEPAGIVDFRLHPPDSTFRRGNDSVAERARRLDPAEAWDFICECGRCIDVVRLPLAEYDRRRANGLPLLLPGHAREADR